MVLILTLFALVLLIVVLLFTVNSKINLILDSASSDVHLTLFWLYPLVKSVVRRNGDKLLMTFYLLNKRILSREISTGPKLPAKSGISRLDPTDIYVEASYGFSDPFVTGLAISAVALAGEFFRVESLQQRPDFLADRDYFSLNATAKLNLGSSLMKLI